MALDTLLLVVALVGLLGVLTTFAVPRLADAPAFGWSCAGVAAVAIVGAFVVMLVTSDGPAPTAQVTTTERASTTARATAESDSGAPDERASRGTSARANAAPTDGSGRGWFGLTLAIVFAAYVTWDAHRRRGSLFWPVGAFLFWPLLVPIWQGVRPLLPGEVRRGGQVWDACRRVAIWATLITAVIVGYLLVSALGAIDAAGNNGFAVLGAAIGLQLVFGYVVTPWFAVTAGALAIGFLARDPEAVERGPPAPADSYTHRHRSAAHKDT
jgi:hypothetical protein